MRRKEPLPRMEGHGGRPPKRYDTDMIQDFLNHLLWEVRIAYEENANMGEGQVNPEFVEELGRYYRKYGAVLLPCQGVDGDRNDPQVQEAFAVLRRRSAAEYAAAVELLEALQPLFEKALAIAKSRTLYQLLYQPEDLLKGDPETGMSTEEDS